MNHQYLRVLTSLSGLYQDKEQFHYLKTVAIVEFDQLAIQQ